MDTKTLRQQIRDICTYHSELGEGTSGYLLSNEQFAEIEQAFLAAVERAKPQHPTPHTECCIDEYHEELVKEITGA